MLDRSALAHNVKPLEREGLVEVVADKHDKRNRLVALTEAGRANLAQSMPLSEEAQRHFERAFGEEKARVFRATLDYIASPEFALRLDCKIIGAVAMFLDLGSDGFGPGSPAASAPIE